MAQYTFISSRDPIHGDRIPHQLSIALATSGHEVTLYLVENGTFLARASVCSDVRQQLKAAGVTILADDVSLSERGITGAHLADGVSATPIDTLLDHLADGRKVTWH